ncbi:MAG TPA: YaeQ family protein [Polyangia bacterium]
MALTATRFEFRISLAHVERGRTGDRIVIAARHPSETHARLTLRVLARCFFDEDNLEFGPDLSSSNAVDLWTKDLTGEVTTWIACGGVAADKLRKIALHHRGVHTHVVFDDPTRADAFAAELTEAGRWGRGAQPPGLWTFDPDLVATLAANEQRRQKWTVTVVGDHVYVEADGNPVDGAITRTPLDESALRAS